MQSNKPSKKTRQITEENSTAVPGLGNVAETSAPRASKSSKSKSDNNETGPARHRKVSSPASETSPVGNPPAAMTMAVSAGSVSQSAGSPVVKSAPLPGAAAPPASVTHEEIATLAHYYWISRGDNTGSAEQDWLRAERDLKAKHSLG